MAGRIDWVRRTIVAEVTALVGFLLLAPAAAASQVGPANVKSGVPVVVLSYAAYDPDTCYYNALPRLKIVQQPAHGTLALGKQARDSGKDTLCPGKTFHASTATYRSSSGFHGRDEMVVEAEMEIYADGIGLRSDRVHIILDVK